MSLTAEREALAAAVTTGTGIRVNAFVPARLNPPEGMILPGSPYIEDGTTYGSFQIRYEVTLASDARVNEAGTRALDQLIEDALVSLVQAGYSVENVAEPYALTANGGQYLAVTITTTQQISI